MRFPFHRTCADCVLSSRWQWSRGKGASLGRRLFVPPNLPHALNRDSPERKRRQVSIRNRSRGHAVHVSSKMGTKDSKCSSTSCTRRRAKVSSFVAESGTSQASVPRQLTPNAATSQAMAGKGSDQLHHRAADYCRVERLALRFESSKSVENGADSKQTRKAIGRDCR
jgi:hypothetical protein